MKFRGNLFNDLMGLADSLDEHVTDDEVGYKLRELANEIDPRTYGKDAFDKYRDEHPDWPYKSPHDIAWQFWQAGSVGGAVTEGTATPEAHDHANEPKLWCETHQHTHIARMPRFTYLCKDCAFGCWYGEEADAHELWSQENRRRVHSTYEVEHVMGPLPLQMEIAEGIQVEHIMHPQIVAEPALLNPKVFPYISRASGRYRCFHFRPGMITMREHCTACEEEYEVYLNRLAQKFYDHGVTKVHPNKASLVEAIRAALASR